MFGLVEELSSRASLSEDKLTNLDFRAEGLYEGCEKTTNRYYHSANVISVSIESLRDEGRRICDTERAHPCGVC